MGAGVALKSFRIPSHRIGIATDQYGEHGRASSVPILALLPSSTLEFKLLAVLCLPAYMARLIATSCQRLHLPSIERGTCVEGMAIRTDASLMTRISLGR